MSYEKNYCAHCGQYSGRYELCNECYQLSKNEYILKNAKGIWVKNVKKGNEYKFYDEKKCYKLKTILLNEYEMRFFNIVRRTLKSKYVIIPQVNLQTIIETDSINRNDELFRNIDFVIYHAEKFIPFLAIELNGQQHYTNEYWIERDKSVKAILNKVQLPLLTIDIKTLKKKTNEDIYNLMKRVIDYLNPSFFKRIFGNKVNKMDLSWTKELLK